MAYYNKETFKNKQEFAINRAPMIFGSLCNFYSNNPKSPPFDKVYEQSLKILDSIWNLGKRFDPFPELEEKLKEKAEKEQKERKIGRYYASELYSYFTNKIPPEKFLEIQIHSLDELQKMYFGEILHLGIQKLFDFQEKKYELVIKPDISLVCKIDLELPNEEIIELKTREDLDVFDYLPDWWNYQLQAYLRVKKLEKMRVYLIGWGLSRREFIVQQNEKIWQYIVQNLKNYHKRVLEAYGKRNHLSN